jgi:oligopeptide/dipeptide ABC transporter ATP-binding protein
VPVVEGVGLELHEGMTLALVGESGCGKSLVASAIMRLLPPAARIDGGRILLDGTDLAELDEKQLMRIRGNRVSMIFQEPMSALNPVFTVGAQIQEALRLHKTLDRASALDRTVELLAEVGIPDPASRAKSYPHELSGGMRQRVLIAMALACEPSLLIADEPTTALDVTIQAQILDLMHDLQARFGTAILFISHDIGVVSQMADHIAVMYAGRIVELGSAEQVLTTPAHPYTRALLATTPSIDTLQTRLATIPGRVPNPEERDAGCLFRQRCSLAEARCATTEPELVTGRVGHSWVCHVTHADG